MAQDPYRYFRLEARELLDQFAQSLLELEKGGDSTALVQRLLRLAHTLKGAARVVKLPEIAEHAHAIEDVLAPLRDVSDPVPADRVNAVLRHVDAVDARVRGLGSPESAEKPKSAEKIAAPAQVVEDAIRTVRTDIADMDTLIDGVSETHALLIPLRDAVGAVEQAHHLADLLVQQLAPEGAVEAAGSRSGARDLAHATADELRRRLGGFERGLGSTIDQMDRELRQLRDSAEQLRLVSAETLFTPLERTARDAAQALGKTVVFDGKGGDLSLDAPVLAIVQNALVQIVRNAVAHGIEPAADRRAAGKPPAGRLAVSVSRRGRQIVFECSDDGSGIDLEAVRNAARRRGHAATGIGRLGADDLVRILLGGGISTSGTVTEVSGRGVGLDVVREAMTRLGGTVAVRTQAGRGTAFELAVPSSLTSIEALVVEAGGMSAAVPLDAVRSSMRITADQISRTSGQASVLFETAAIPFVPLSRMVDGSHPPMARSWSSLSWSGPVGVLRSESTGSS